MSESVEQTTAPAASLPDDAQETALRALADVDGVAWDDVTNGRRRTYEGYVAAVLAALPPAARAALARGAGGPSWDDELRVALQGEFNPRLVEQIMDADAFLVFSDRLQEFAEEEGLRAHEALQRIEPSARRFAARGADNPAAFLAARVPGF